MPAQPKLQVFILSHNRSKYILEAIRSFELQEYENFELIISDNSTDESVRKLLNEKCQHRVVLRQPGINVFQHYNEVLADVTSSYFMIFHDDDLMRPMALKRMMDEFTTPDIVAVSCNAYLLNENVQTELPFNLGLKRNHTIQTRKELARFYVRGYKYINPFSSYIFRNSVKQVRFGNEKLGKYSDVAFLIDVCRLGSVKWLNESLMSYRFHGANDSGKVDYKSLNGLCDYLEKEGELSKTEVRDFYHSVNLMRALREKDMKNILSSGRFYAFHPLMFLARLKDKIK